MNGADDERPTVQPVAPPGKTAHFKRLEYGVFIAVPVDHVVPSLLESCETISIRPDASEEPLALKQEGRGPADEEFVDVLVRLTDRSLKTQQVLWTLLPGAKGSPRRACLHRLTEGGTIHIEAAALDNASVGLAVEHTAGSAKGEVRIEISPSLALLRQEYDRAVGQIHSTCEEESKEPSTARSEMESKVKELDTAFSRRTLAHLPNGVWLWVSSEPGEVDAFAAKYAADQSGLADWIEAQLERRNAPLAVDGCYSAVLLQHESGLGYGLIVRYTSRQTTTPVQNWLQAALTDVPHAFRSPLLATAQPPSGLTADALVPVELSNVLAAGNGAEGNDPLDVVNARTQEVVRRAGAEALGWYQSFHAWDEDHWGIYLHTARLVDVTRLLFERLSEAGRPASLEDAFEVIVRLIWEHEFFHARLDFFSLERELLGERALALPYTENVYSKTQGTRGALEEALANYAAREAVVELLEGWKSRGRWDERTVRAALQFIDEFFEQSPPGYSDWQQGADPLIWRRLVSQVLGGQIEPERLLPFEDLLRKAAATTLLRPGDVPLWMTDDHPLAERLLQVPTRREVERCLEHYGYSVLRRTGHIIWGREGDPHVFPLSHGRMLSPGVFQQLLRLPGVNLTKEKYYKQRRAWA